MGQTIRQKESHLHAKRIKNCSFDGKNAFLDVRFGQLFAPSYIVTTIANVSKEANDILRYQVAIFSLCLVNLER